MATASLLSLFLLAAGCWALPSQGTPACRAVDIPITVQEPRFIINTTISNDWDAASLVFNLTRRDSGSSADPIPISGSTASPVQSNYTIGGTLCGTGATILVLTHGIIESKAYWDPTFPGSDPYNFVKAAVAAGYSVLNYDRIGVGSSSRVDGLFDAQFQVETAVLNSLVDYARRLPHVSKVGLVGHSYGSYLAAASAASVAVDALVLTGFSSAFDYFGYFLAGSHLRQARTLSPSRWGTLDSAYLTAGDQYAVAYYGFAAPHFDPQVAQWAATVEGEPFAVGELPSLLASPIQYSRITAPVYLVQGQFDLSSCGGNCKGQLENSPATFNNSHVVSWVDDLPAGHNLNLHTVAPQAFQLIFKFLQAQGL
ncbi:alpha/beta fold hydrolase [Aspergillus aculeatinus CBS 121060]|uniref:Alpha/beta-hydrolase n=1 Tax=Aspergillus aculeatinus CBS 121060 TaxID=1448322 RepID=A0ACD1H438_9EURO|nr:alpha/beta-hydrolase [Aspergillus aculeatinus CBS 121060]RAH68264.1 alpha/beta-hydrolase [Aspergillus aculeatinus CBS 121060]